MEVLDENKIKKCLTDHRIIAFPTETVMGLGIYFDDEIAFENLNRIKGRPSDKPYTLMLANKQNIQEFAYLNDKDKLIIDAFMPGPITILLRSKPNLPKWVDLGTGIIGVRVPDYEESLKVLNAAGKPLLVPSANKSGENPALNGLEVKNIFGDEVGYIIEGEAGKQKPSNIVDLTKGKINIIREGPITFEDINKVIGE